RGGAWASDGSIVVSAGPGFANGLSRVSAGGGKPQALTTPDARRGEVGHRWPEMLPDGKDALLTIWTPAAFDQARIGVVSLSTGQVRVLMEGGTNPRYAPVSPGKGYVVFGRGGALHAAPMDLARLQVTGSSFPVVDGVVANGRTGAVQCGLAGSGSLVYQPSTGRAQSLLVWVD